MQKSRGVCTCDLADACSGAAAAKISGKSKNIQPLGEANLRDRDQAASRKSAGRRFMIAVFSPESVSNESGNVAAMPTRTTRLNQPFCANREPCVSCDYV